MRNRNIVPRRTPIHQMREPYATISDRVMARDREYFEAHPEAESYQRQYVPGEFSPDALKAMYGSGIPEQDCFVLVTQLASGFRTRALIGAVTYTGAPK